MKHKKVLFVCSGNLSRSPMAEAIFEDMVRSDVQMQSTGICARSAGTLNLGGYSAAEEAIQVMIEKGLDISPHMSRHIDANIVDWADVILVMKREHEQYVLEQFPNARGKVHLLAEFAGEEGEIPDPLNCGIEVYRECRDRLVSLIGVVMEKMKEEARM